MSLQNEPAAVQTWDSCVYTVEEEKEFLRDHLFPEMKKRGLAHVEIFGWDHNKERLFERACGLIDEETDPMICGLAFHWYSGDHFEALDLVRQKYPDKKLILSESCLEFGKYDRSLETENARPPLPRHDREPEPRHVRLLRLEHPAGRGGRGAHRTHEVHGEAGRDGLEEPLRGDRLRLYEQV